MSKSKGILDSAVKVIFLILMGLIGSLFSGSLFTFFFVPVIGWYVWSTHDKAADLEKRLAAIEKPAPRPEGA